MDRSIDIQFYDLMIENTIEDRKIMELIMGSQTNNLLHVNESSEELAIYEANVFETILIIIK